MKWFAQAPANIALIKYMGKDDSEHNIPSNSSLSYTLNDLLSFIELEDTSNHEDFWEPLQIPSAHPFDLDEAGQQRFLNHLHFLKKQFSYEGGFIVRSCNNFPISSGLASSASSFAALTKVFGLALSELTGHKALSNTELANLSRQGSGSSCRSFFSPWALWTDKKVEAINLPYDDLIHHAIIVTHEIKSVPSSEAHERVKSSPLFEKRMKAVNKRLKRLTTALKNKNWQDAYQLVWDEFQEMHTLFDSSEPPFSYMTDASLAILNDIQRYWETNHDGPLITMDAGPNVHLLFRADQSTLADSFKTKFLNNYDVI